MTLGNASEDIVAGDTTLAGSAACPAARVHVLKHADTFAVCDDSGDILGRMGRVGAESGAEGLFQDDTRILSRYVLTLGGEHPLLLSSHVSRDNVLLVVDLTNPEIDLVGAGKIVERSLHIRRSRFLWQRRLYEEIRIRNYEASTVRVPLELAFDADFRDVFEVRGAVRDARGESLEGTVEAQALSLAYRGRDGRQRAVWIEMSAPTEIHDRTASFAVDLPVGGEAFLLLTVGMERRSDLAPTRATHRRAAATARRAIRNAIGRGARIRTSNPMFDRWLRRARDDLALLTTDLGTGPYPYAGIPWFSTPFGRDAIITALEVLWLDPGVARGVLNYLAARQATTVCAFHDSEPGKIMHETRKGEMALLGEVPYLSYFGGVDTTPLFIMLAGAYYARTKDLDFIGSIWPAVQAALDWIDGYGDADGDGFVEYERQSAEGLANQGWKDSHDAVFHADGRDAEGPIALCEVQGYVFAAKQRAAEMADALDQTEHAARLRSEAETLQARFERTFWCEELGTYVLALDGAKRPCRVRASNTGHLLYCGIVAPDRAERVAEQLVGPSFFSGWGVRTVAASERRYNPMSYHNGSIWPHDTAVIAAGLGRYGFRTMAGKLLQGMFDTAAAFDDFRLPELFCGFRRSPSAAPTAYPVACVPQAWASGAVYLLLEACLGLTVDAERVTVANPVLPHFLSELVVRDLRVGNARASLCLRRVDGAVEASLIDTVGDFALDLGTAPAI